MNLLAYNNQPDERLQVIRHNEGFDIQPSSFDMQRGTM